ncbi:MAG: DUF465 domain-containing protein [Acidobacteria bacterium]|nr:DUF465 domain-containing protein [Acidobacteriota bacterium]MBI3657120.1 DUF465 domain-containing protein [Acidobacteriota bacterium]
MQGEAIESTLKERLFDSDDEFRRLAMEHKSHSERLEQLSVKPFLNDSEKLEEVTLKKKKLHLKDQMQSIINRYREAFSG